MINYSGLKDQNFLFATYVNTERSEKSTFILIESIQAFSGAFCDKPIWCLVPKDDFALSEKVHIRFKDLNVKTIPFKSKSNVDFPFADLVTAVGHAEDLALNQAEYLAWLNPNSIILHEPTEFFLSEKIKFGYRPVHHTLIGSLFDAPPDEFWSLIYDYCDVPYDSVFPMKTHVDNKVIRPYFNAGCHVTRPKTGLLKMWEEKFFEIYQKKPMKQIYEQNNRYKVFLHQAVLSGIILSNLEKEEIFEFSSSYNYPLHLFNEDVNENRPLNLNDMTTIRHEGFFEDPNWKETIPLKDPFKEWINTKLSYLQP